MNNPQWLGYFDRLAGISAEAVPRNDGDYIGEDGLLYPNSSYTKYYFNGRLVAKIVPISAGRCDLVLC